MTIHHNNNNTIIMCTTHTHTHLHTYACTHARRHTHNHFASSTGIAQSGAAKTIVVGVWLGELVAPGTVTSARCVQPLNIRCMCSMQSLWWCWHCVALRWAGIVLVHNIWCTSNYGPDEGVVNGPRKSGNLKALDTNTPSFIDLGVPHRLLMMLLL